MKRKLLDWGFTPLFIKKMDVYELKRGYISVTVALNSNELEFVAIEIGNHSTQVPNCNTGIMLFTLLYQLGLVEV